MKALITGGGGQVATELASSAPPGITPIVLARADVDIRDRARVLEVVRLHAPAIIINTAAYTAVDKAESEPELAAAINRDGAGFVAAAAADVGAFCVQLSTDFVFDGTSGTPYKPASPPNPLSVYGRTKLEGELAVRAACPDAAILRTAWVYATHGQNFLRTMLRLMAERPEVRVVCDQIGTPTHAGSVAAAAWALATKRAAGCWHWTDGGVASWYDFAVAIADTAHAMGRLPKRPAVVPIATEEYPTPARRPAYSVLDKRGTSLVIGIRPEHWREILASVLQRAQTA